MIEGTVADILNEYEIIVNRGTHDGVEKDMRFIIYTVGEDITDPETGERLGNIEHKKATVSPKHIQENMTVMRTTETTTYDTGLSGISALTGGVETKPKKIANRPTNAVDNKVKIGDKVRQNITDE